MLTTLRIKNLALVPDLTLDLPPGYLAVTGETGAGKSIIIGALNLVLGVRADRSLIRSGAESCTVEAVFKVDRIPALMPLLEARGLEPCEENQLVLKRGFSASGANRQFVNGSPATLAVLGEIGDFLVDMHGPHDHQSLLQPARQLEILDAYGELDAPRQAFAAAVEKRAGLIRAKAELIVDERAYAQQVELLRFQSREIAAANLDPATDREIESEYSRAQNATRLIELARGALAALSDDDHSLLNQAGAIGRSLAELGRLDPSSTGLADQHTQLVEILHDLQRELSRYADGIEVEPARLRELEERIDLLQTLRRKYGTSIEDMIEFGTDAREKLQLLESRDTELERINHELRRIEDELWKKGSELSAARRKVVPSLGKAAVKQLNDLGFKQSSLEVRVTSSHREDAFKGAVPATGFDTVEFLFAPNPGEPAKALRAIASSGELARVMLALKTVLAVQDSIPVLVFDEVDANVGGETAVMVGDKMRQIGARRQVLCITHLAQVAAAATAHFVVIKELLEGRTVSTIKRIDGKARVSELARMLGGGDAARKHAETMLTKK